MRILKNALMLFVLGILMTSCSPNLSPFTNDIYNDFGSDRQLSKIQFYLSNDIVLFRDYGGQRAQVTNGKIKVVNGRKIEEVVFKKGTPGVFVFSPKRDRIAVSFESEDDKYLMFGPNRKAGGRFVLLAKEWNRRTGKVTYGGEVWNTTDGSAYANLLVDLDKARETSVSKKVVGGRRVGGS